MSGTGLGSKKKMETYGKDIHRVWGRMGSHASIHRGGKRVDILRGLKVGDSLRVSGVNSAIAWQQYGQPARRLKMKISITNEGADVRIRRVA